MKRAFDFFLILKNFKLLVILTKASQQRQNIVYLIVSSLRKKGQYKNFCNAPKYSFEHLNVSNKSF